MKLKNHTAVCFKILAEKSSGPLALDVAKNVRLDKFHL